MTRKKGTATSRFGVSRRESHDSSAYYRRELPKAVTTNETTVNWLPPMTANRLFCASSTDMTVLPDNSVALMVTSPSYHVGKEYDTDETYPEFMELLRQVFTETYRVLEPGGRAAINVANLGRKPYIDLRGDVAEVCKDIGFLPTGEIIWVKGKGAAGNAAWGSWRKPSAPVLRDLHEYILIFQKGNFKRALPASERKAAGLPHEPTVTAENFMRDTLSVWYVHPESARRVGHPAPFPVELPRRLIELYTWRGDVVLDPFMGSGSTALAAKETGRRWVGFDIDPGYLSTALKRLSKTRGEA